MFNPEWQRCWLPNTVRDLNFPVAVLMRQASKKSPLTDEIHGSELWCQVKRKPRWS
jgi:hypothetical protein